MKVLLLFFTIIATVISCKAQQEYPLNSNRFELPQYSYLKDLNNELNSYVGTYQANIDGKQITLYITKEEHKYFEILNNKFYKDILSIRYIIKNTSGLVLQSTQNMVFQPKQFKHTIYSTNIMSDGEVKFSYGGTNCNIGLGDIFLKKLNATQISWRYYAETVATSHERCAPNVDKSTYLPEGENLIFTKQ